MKKTHIHKSSIHGEGLFAGEKIKIGDFVCEVANVEKETVITNGAIKLNHSDDSNCDVIVIGTRYYLMAIKKIHAREELTIDYSKLPEILTKKGFTLKVKTT